MQTQQSLHCYGKKGYAGKNNLQVTVKSKFIGVTPFSLILKDILQHKHLGLEDCFYLVFHRDISFTSILTNLTSKAIKIYIYELYRQRNLSVQHYSSSTKHSKKNKYGPFHAHLIREKQLKQYIYESSYS